MHPCPDRIDSLYIRKERQEMLLRLQPPQPILDENGRIR